MQRDRLAKTLVAFITQDWEREGEATLRLEALTPFGWDRVYIFPPYTTPEGVRKSLGFDWPKASAIGIDSRDDINLLVFVKDGRVVQYVAYPRVHGDFHQLGDPSGYSPEEAVFVVEEEEAPGQSRFVLHEMEIPE